MENKNALLKKLGFSDDYLKIIESENQSIYFQQVQAQPNLFENQIIVSELTSLIIDKTDKPMHTHFIYNQK
jgi:hypothetical protein|tara:strand:+ start:150 stop:362 length:213 start_codon:yes stop_codon:yes gene_type:complete